VLLVGAVTCFRIFGSKGGSDAAKNEAASDCLSDTGDMLTDDSKAENTSDSGSTKEEPADDSEPLGLTKMLGHPAVATIITVCLGVGLALVGYQNIWGLFGSANQLLAVLAILAICAWLGNAGLENRMLYIPMAFMLLATLTSLILTIYNKLMIVMDSFDAIALIQAIIAILLFILALVLMKDGVKVLRGQRDS
jgi:carbon starvation protein CstA